MITLAAVRRVLRDHRPQPADAPGARPAAVALILVEDTNGLEALFIRRAERADDPWSDLLATAIRETREETGVDLAAAERLGALDDLYPRTPTLPPVVVRPFVFALERRVVLVPSDEVQRAFWLPLQRLTDPAVRREVTLTVQGVERTFPAYRVADDALIWGLTERILTPFLHLAGQL